MKLKPYREKKNYFNRFLKIYFYLSVLLILLSPFVIYQTGLWNKYKLEFVKRIHLNGMSNYKFIPNIIILVASNMLNNIEKTVDLNINQENLIILENNRENKLKNPETSWEEVEGFLISENNKKIETNIRLKGDRLYHYENRDHSSYKINTKSETFNKLSSFSIQKPRARNYIHEWIFHKLSHQLDVVSLDYEFVKFKLNGENQGLYVIEESFSNNLLEKNKRRAGPIFGLQEEFETANLENIVLDPYQINFWERPENLNLYLDSKKKLLKFFKKEINLEDLFDIEKWSAYFALCDLLNTHHGALLKSVKFYYNPITQKFEPIAFDGHKLPAYDPSPIIDELNLSSRIVLDINFISEKKRELYFKATNCVVLPYDFIFQSGVLLMSMSYGLPVVASRIPPFEEIIDDGINGLLFEKGNIKALAKKINHLMNDKNLLNKIPQNAINHMKNNFSWDSVAKYYIEIIKSL